MSYPILLDLRGRLVVVIGGGMVAARKTADLLEAGAEVTVISPVVHPRLIMLAGRIEIRHDFYEPGLLAKLIDWDMRPLLVFAATDSSEVNQQVADEACALHILVNVVDEGGTGDFSNMATIHRGEITIAVSTGGASPALAAHLRGLIESAVGEEYTLLAHWLGENRALVRAQVDAETRRELWSEIIASPALELLRDGDERAARAIIDALIESAIDRQ